jgi:hypothetical protein
LDPQLLCDDSTKFLGGQYPSVTDNRYMLSVYHKGAEKIEKQKQDFPMSF